MNIKSFSYSRKYAIGVCLTVILAVLLGIAPVVNAASDGSEFLGKWVNAKNAKDIIQISRNGNQFLLTVQRERIGAVLKDGSLEISGPFGPLQITYIVDSGTLSVPEVNGMKEYIRSIHDLMYKHDIKGIKTLVGKGADINAKNENGWTVMHIFAYGHEKNDDEFLKALLAMGANIDAKDSHGKTPLETAISSHSVAQIQLLIKHGADLKAKDEYGDTYLARNIGSPYMAEDVIELLLQKGVDVNAVNYSGKTVLDKLLQRKDEEDKYSIKDEYALKRSAYRAKIAEFLRKHGAKTGKEVKQASVPQKQGVTPNSRTSLLSVCPAGKLGEFHYGTKCTGFYDAKGIVDIGLRGAKCPKAFTHIKDLVHGGVDIVAVEGSDIYAIADGNVADVIDSGDDKNFDSLGYMVIIKHKEKIDGKNVYSLYLHMKDKPKVEVPDEVIAGKTVLGQVGHTGAAFGSHLHMEIRHFKDRFSPKWKNIYGKESPKEEATFDAADFAANWIDPEKFGGSASSVEVKSVENTPTVDVKFINVMPIPLEVSLDGSRTAETIRPQETLVKKLPPGQHVLRVVAPRQGNIPEQAREARFTTPPGGTFRLSSQIFGGTRRR